MHNNFFGVLFVGSKLVLYVSTTWMSSWQKQKACGALSGKNVKSSLTNKKSCTDKLVEVESCSHPMSFIPLSFYPSVPIQTYVQQTYKSWRQAEPTTAFNQLTNYKLLLLHTCMEDI